MPDLLIELFSEEIPARMQRKAGEDLQRMLTGGLQEAGLTFAETQVYTTPRRLTLAVSDLLSESPTTSQERKGPKVDAPEKAIEGFLRSTGLTRDQVEERETPKGTVLYAVIEKPGRPAGEIIAEVLGETIRQFPWPKSMRWGSGSLRWVRPLHSILCILSNGSEHSVVPLEVDGIAAGDTTRGHRFMAPAECKVTGFADYQAQLEQAHVILDPAQRATLVWDQATRLAQEAGLEVVEDRGLLQEVAGLVEFPVALMGEIADEFLELPPEVLQTSMREHQKFFSVRNPGSGRIERFITVANRETSDQGATILAGNRKVLGARLADAAFFWENDLRVARADMRTWTDALASVTFHNKLGSQADRIQRIASLAKVLASSVGADPQQAEQAAGWAKADLSSEMVYEFPELQGLMGRYYIAAAGNDPDVARVAEEHYSPLGPSDDVPTAPLSVAVALADKLDILTGFWAIDEKPTGSKDPYALRRAALGVIRLILENDLTLSLKDSIEAVRFSESVLPNAQAAVAGISADLLAFVHDRLKVYLRDQGVRHDIIDACIGMPNNDDLSLLVKRARALSETLATDDGENLIQGFKRANNILTQAEEADGTRYADAPNPSLAEGAEEQALFAALDQAEAEIHPAMQQQAFTTAMGAMAGLRGPIDAFFEAVQINTENQDVRRNRLNLLNRIRGLCLAVADLTRIEG